MVYFFHHYELPVILQQAHLQQFLLRNTAQQQQQREATRPPQAASRNPLTARITQLLSTLRSTATTQTSTTGLQTGTTTTVSHAATSTVSHAATSTASNSTSTVSCLLFVAFWIRINCNWEIMNMSMFTTRVPKVLRTLEIDEKHLKNLILSQHMFSGTSIIRDSYSGLVYSTIYFFFWYLRPCLHQICLTQRFCFRWGHRRSL